MSQQNNVLDQIIRSLIPNATKGSTWPALVVSLLGFILCGCGLLALISWLLLGCWNGFASPILGLRHMDFGNAVWFTTSLLIALFIIALLKESKDK